MWKSVVTHIGAMALEFVDDKVLVFFGPAAPDALRDVSIIHESAEPFSGSLCVGDKLVVDGQDYEISKVGTQAQGNLQELGHISVYFTDAPDDILPGSIYVTPHRVPQVKLGSVIEIRQR
ncbi:PTS sorbitol transporter subunit IIA [Alicyclobacillus contaminans]|uniref:PTS glucitol/sorbitol transporter subunit IIA n=1 Tax=Alicyclobacillus contaminans TaxID=392016 RepID=UPI00047973E8|nr:PTS glucitol/sorbitol transporter subunit IIA [Alicyclobacillus contaminans]GMA50864.1 PTS sorbitol transporter subunit IIA [Alicyclobacillus contaminans]